MALITTAMVQSTRTSATTTCGAGEREETVHNCVNGEEVACGRNSQALEVDGLDNDCDGAVDEDLAPQPVVLASAKNRHNRVNGMRRRVSQDNQAPRSAWTG
jgi:hypothetical protein